MITLALHYGIFSDDYNVRKECPTIKMKINFECVCSGWHENFHTNSGSKLCGSHRYRKKLAQFLNTGNRQSPLFQLLLMIHNSSELIKHFKKSSLHESLHEALEWAKTYMKDSSGSTEAAKFSLYFKPFVAHLYNEHPDQVPVIKRTLLAAFEKAEKLGGDTKRPR